MRRRIIWFYVWMLVGVTVIFLRLSALAVGEPLAAAAQSQSSYVLEVGAVRGYFYDRNLKPLVNREERTVLAVAPTPDAMQALQEALPSDRLEESLALLQSQKPLVLTAQAPAQGEGVLSFAVPVRYQQDQLATHLIGYTDATGHGVCGLEQGYDEQLSQWGGRIRVKYLVNASGGVISTDAQEVEDTLSDARGGVVLTIDREVQQVVEDAMSEIPKGAAVVMKAGTGEILAMVSRPTYDVNDLAGALDDPDSPFLNRAVNAYPLGSAFKVCVAAAALEAGYAPDLS